MNRSTLAVIITHEEANEVLPHAGHHIAALRIGVSDVEMFGNYANFFELCERLSHYSTAIVDKEAAKRMRSAILKICTTIVLALTHYKNANE
jgi:hypothetical protein